MNDSNLSIYDIPIKHRAKELMRYSGRLVAAIELNDPISQLEAEDSLKKFVLPKGSENAPYTLDLKCNLDEIVKQASSTHPNKLGLIFLQCGLIASLVNNNVYDAIVLQEHYDILNPE